MRLSTRGQAVNISEPVVGTITTSAISERSTSILLADGQDATGDSNGYRGILTRGRVAEPGHRAIVHSVRETDHLADGDIVAMDPRGAVRTLFRPASVHNTLFLTERCNSNCLMCSQPPKDQDDTEFFLKINTELVNLIPSTTATLGITGGEPTLLRDDLCALLGLLKDRLPETHVHLLTNGRLFAWPDFTAQFAAVDHPSLVLGIPLYSDSAPEHDYIVQARGAFDQTIVGLHHLARWGVAVELRIVLHKLSIPRLRPLAEFIYRNLPFAVHIAFMGLEPTGYTPYNREKLWIDPFECREVLAEAVNYLSMRGMRVSVYNLQRCVIPEALWGYARQSISDWKNIYLPECDGCAERSSCAGFFASAEKIHSGYIHAL
jgi:His-Xaa-Ser system radical SAM maturase HxsC